MAKLLTALGLMSGTSLDGIDAAIIRTDGEGAVEAVAAASTAYDPEQRKLLVAALEEARCLDDRTKRPGALAAAERMLDAAHARAAMDLIGQAGLTPEQIDVIGLHGQTVIHRAERRLTVQLGDGAVLAKATGIPVVCDMRAADVAAGGHGAPLAPAYHRALAGRIAERPVVFVNIGGVSNVTFIGETGDPIAFDAGPGNAFMDDWALSHTGEPIDRDGLLAASGVLDSDAFMTLAQDRFFETPPPKSLDRNGFDLTCLEGLRPADGAATLMHFTATSIARSLAWFPQPPEVWVICGGGRHNPALMKEVRGLLEPLGQTVLSAEQAGIDGDSVEAEAWAYLAVRSLRGLPLSWPTTTGVSEPLTGGVRFAP